MEPYALNNKELKQLAELEQQGSDKITSESYHVGFSTSQVGKQVGSGENKLPSSSSSDTKVELPNPTPHRGLSSDREDVRQVRTTFG